MIEIKGFIAKADIASNETDRVAAFGELSTYCRTFAKDIGIYTDADSPGLELNVYSHKANSAAAGLVLPTRIKKILNVAKAVYAKGAATTVTTSRTDYQTDLVHTLASDIETATIGTIVEAMGVGIPDWVQFKLVDAEEVIVKIWFTNTAFERDWDEYEITVVSPLANVDTLFRPVAEIRAALSAVTPSSVMDLVDTAKAKHPETTIKIETTHWVNPNDTSVQIPISWYLVIYGPQGANGDNIKRAIINYILANSRQPESAWKQILPYLFKNTVIYVLPRWEKLAIPNRHAGVGIYSPITTLTEDLTYLKTALPHLATRFIDENAQVTHHKWRSITLLTCGGEDNARDKFKLTDYIPDYIGEGTASLDYSRMSAESRNWTVAMEEMLIIAESITAAGSLPIHTRRASVSNVNYIVRKIGDVEYYVALKE